MPLKMTVEQLITERTRIVAAVRGRKARSAAERKQINNDTWTEHRALIETISRLSLNKELTITYSDEV